MVKIISDSTCDLSPELVNRYDIDILPLHILLGEKEYKDGKKKLADAKKELEDGKARLADAKKELQNAIASANTSQTDALNNAINNLTNGTITDLSNSVNQNKAAQDAVNTSVQTSIDVINNQLNGCTIEYIDGHFYVTHDKGGADPVSKKLDYAQ